MRAACEGDEWVSRPDVWTTKVPGIPSDAMAKSGGKKRTPRHRNYSEAGSSMAAR